MTFRITFAVLAALAAVALPQCAVATDWRVGDNSGWTINEVNYTKWAEDKVFKVGDKLIFSYDPENHNVFKVDQHDFQTCTVPVSGGLTTGHDVITLATPGKKWYICGKGTHCSEFQQKLVINVVGDPLTAPAPAPDKSRSSRLILGAEYLFMMAVASVFFF
uniref:Phytocyanin domain-containing protein n=1 Tax=Kalanchoe fedtschenkoi TaxID=63787 RepID=A0A7N0SYQ9_KALFE